MPFKGDISDLGNLVSVLGKLAEVPSKVAGDVSEKLADLIDEEFEADVDPYGEPWEPLMASTIDRKHGDDRILERTGDMRNDVDVRPMAGAGIRISIAGGREGDAGAYHQNGAPGTPMVARPVLPGSSSDGNLPPSWADAIDEAGGDAFREAAGQ